MDDFLKGVVEQLDHCVIGPALTIRNEGKAFVVRIGDLVRLMRYVSSIEEKQWMRQLSVGIRRGVVLDHAQCLSFKDVLLVRVSRAGIESMGWSIISPQINAGQVLGGLLWVAGIDRATALPPCEVVILVVKIYQRV